MRPSSEKQRLQQLTNLLHRGQRLAYQNVVQLTGAVSRMSALTLLVYTGAQLVYAFSLMEAQKYLDDNEHDAFTDALFQSLAQNEGVSAERLLPLFERYGAAFMQRDMEILFLQDLAASIGGKGRSDVQNLLSGAPRTLKRLTHLHVAQVFGDVKTLQANS